jgi:multidrug efflux pump subunit AcrB
MAHAVNCKPNRRKEQTRPCRRGPQSRGRNALTQVLQGEQRYDLVMRYLPQFRNTKEAIENIRLLAPTGERVSLGQLCKIEERGRRR